MLSVAAIMLVGVLVLAGCKKNEPLNDAAQFCIDNGGTHQIVTSETAVFGECTLPDGTVCEEWEYFEWTCWPNAEEDVNIEKDYLVLVNKQHPLPENWEEKLDLVDVQNVYDETIQIDRETLEQFNKLRDALLEEWIDIELDSVYRSVWKQQELWNQFEEEYGLDYTKQYVAVPGLSEHHTSYAVDVALIKDGELIWENDAMIAEKEIFTKVHAKLAEFGFILRYPEWKEDITEYGYEPWHFRYIKDVNIAKEIMDNWLTLEEYLEEK